MRASISKPAAKVYKTPVVKKDKTPEVQKAKILNIEGAKVDVKNMIRYDEITHMLKKTDMLFGSLDPETKPQMLFDEGANRIVTKKIQTVEALTRMIIEVQTNATDNAVASRLRSVDPGIIEMKVSNDTVEITNYGLTLPVEKHPEYGVWTVELLFGNMRTSTNYGEDNTGAGTYGIGVKGVNILSSWFRVVVLDHFNHVEYTQEWWNNMREKSDPIITPYRGTGSMVQVTFNPDFSHINVPGISQDMINLFLRMSIDMSFTAKIPVKFNGVDYDYSNPEDYATLYFGEIESDYIIHSEDHSDQTITEFIAIDTPYGGHSISFANGIMTPNGGVHVNEIYRVISDVVIGNANEKIKAKLDKDAQKSGGKAKVKDLKASTITVDDVKKHLTIVVSVFVKKPKFAGQTKDSLKSPVPVVSLNTQEKKKIKEWRLGKVLEDYLKTKQLSQLMPKTKSKFVKKGVDANRAGTSESHLCTLYAGEGQSASGYIDEIISLSPGNRDYIGIIELKGKGLNVTNAAVKKFSENSEIQSMIHMLGLDMTVLPEDRAEFYLNPDNRKKLRYGKFVITTDADTDGDHIKGITINFFAEYAPSLFKIGFIQSWLSPILRAIKGDNIIKFYDKCSYKMWLEEIGGDPKAKGYEILYFKGLGSSKEEDIADDYNHQRVVIYIYDEFSAANLTLAFNKEYTDARKAWISSYDPDLCEPLPDDEVIEKTIADFVNTDLILFSREDVARSLPRLLDGLKEVQRKIIYAAKKRWNPSTSSTAYKRMKVKQFSSYVAEKTEYHHGEDNLDGIIVNMAQDFVDSNNMPWFVPDGNFGKRYKRGKNASNGRYIHTQPSIFFPLVLRQEDDENLDYKEDDGKMVEPITYYPIICTALCNPIRGAIGTGSSSTVPGYNPLDIIAWTARRLQGYDPSEEHEAQQEDELMPWYEGFTGEIEIDIRGGGELIEDKRTLKDGLFKNKTKGKPTKSIITKGIFRYDEDSDVVIITEIPIGISAHKYYTKILQGMVEKGIAVDVKNNCYSNIIYFEIHGYSGTLTHKALGLQTSISMGNMVFLDNKDQVHRFNSPMPILEIHYQERLYMYNVRKTSLIAKVDSQINTLNQKIKLLEMNARGELDHLKGLKTRADAVKILEELGISADVVKKISLIGVTEEDITELYVKLEKLTEQKDDIINTSAEEMWLEDLKDLEHVVIQYYNNRAEARYESLISGSNRKVAKAKRIKKRTGGAKASKTAKPKKTTTSKK